MIALLIDAQALETTNATEITALTERATRATYFTEGLSDEQLKSIVRVNRMAWDCVSSASANAFQRLIAAQIDGRLVGFVIATVHADDNRELDWIMVDPDFHGAGVAGALMDAGLAWLGRDCPIWLNVIRHNARAVRFYERHGFAIDPDATTDHAIPHYIMRRGA